MSTPSYSDTKTAVSALVVKLQRESQDSSRINSGLTEAVYNGRDLLFNEPKQTGANGVLKGADDALTDDSPFRESSAVNTAVPG